MNKPKTNPLKKDTGYIDFLEEIIRLSPNDSLERITYFISNLPNEVNLTIVKKHLQKCYENGNLGSVKDHLNASLITIDNLQKIFDVTEDKQSLANANALKSNINIILGVVGDVIKENSEPKQPDSNNATYLESYEAKITEISGSIGKLEERVNDQANTMNDKLFSLILNTIAILGIFVAIAFAGLSAVSIFSELNINTKDNLLVNAFYLFLVCWFVYNLLFLLLYFVFRIVQKVSDTEKDFKCEMIWFLIIDAIILLITIALFFCSLKFT